MNEILTGTFREKDRQINFAIEELEKIKAEVDKKYDELYVIDEFTNGKADSYVELFEIIDKHISELKGEQK